MTMIPGRHRATDGHHRIGDDATPTKTRAATFHGNHFIAEREGDDLCIYAIGDGDGIPGAAVQSGGALDASPAGLRELNRRNAGLRGER